MVYTDFAMHNVNIIVIIIISISISSSSSQMPRNPCPRIN